METITRHQDLPSAIKSSASGGVIRVSTEVLKELGERAAERMGKDPKFEVVDAEPVTPWN